MSTADTDWSWKRALGIAGLALAASVAVSGVTTALAAPPGADMEKLGQAAGQAAAVTALIAFGASFCRQTGRLRLGSSLYLLVGGMILAVPIVAALAPAPAPELPAAARADFQARDGRLVHPALGLSFAADTQALTPMREVADRFVSGPRQAGWAWRDEGRETTIVLLVQTERGPSVEASRQDLLDGIWTGLTRSARDAGMEVTSEGGTDRRRGRMGKLSIVVGALPFTTDGIHYTAVVAVIGQAREAVEATFGSFRAP